MVSRRLVGALFAAGVALFALVAACGGSIASEVADEPAEAGLEATLADVDPCLRGDPNVTCQLPECSQMVTNCSRDRRGYCLCEVARPYRSCQPFVEEGTTCAADEACVRIREWACFDNCTLSTGKVGATGICVPTASLRDR